MRVTSIITMFQRTEERLMIGISSFKSSARLAGVAGAAVAAMVVVADTAVAAPLSVIRAHTYKPLPYVAGWPGQRIRAGSLPGRPHFDYLQHQRMRARIIGHFARPPAVRALVQAAQQGRLRAAPPWTLTRRYQGGRPLQVQTVQMPVQTGPVGMRPFDMQLQQLKRYYDAEADSRALRRMLSEQEFRWQCWAAGGRAC